MIERRPRWPMILLMLGLSVSEPLQSRVDQEADREVDQVVDEDTSLESGCPGHDLSRYLSRSYATDKGLDRRCRLLMEIERDGELTPDGLSVRIRNELAKRFAVTLEFSGEVGLPRRAVDYLLGHMPETAALVNLYSDKGYRATQTSITRDRERFFVTNNDTFAAGFTYLFTGPDPDVTEHMFFETGYAKVLFWRVWGNAFVHYRLWTSGLAASSYDIDVHVFMESRVLRTLLDSRPFRWFAGSMFDDILEDIESAVKSFAAASNPGEALPPYFVMGLKKRLRAAVDGSMPRERRISSQHRESNR